MALISGTVNVLALTGSFYMLQVYDRVLSSKSVPTLLALSLIALLLYLFQGALEITRSQLLVRIGNRLDRSLVGAAHEAAVRLPLHGRHGSEAQQPLRDIDTIRSFLGGQGPVAILDMPWMPLYVAFIFILHPVLGLVTLAGAVVLVGLTLWTERLTQEPAREVVKYAAERSALADAATRNAEVLHAMGFRHRAQQHYARASGDFLRAQERLSDLTGGFSATSRILRMILQSAIIGLGAYFTIRGNMSAGAIIACSIAASRAYAPIEIAIAHWKSFVSARQSVERLRTVLSSMKSAELPLVLPRPSKSLSVENVHVAVPGSQRLVVAGVSFELNAGQALAVIGQSAAGKSTLARAMVGVWTASRGTVRLDGATLDMWSNADLGSYIGYLPQDVELFDGTIKDNISRFEEDPPSKAVIAAAQAAGVHEMILRLPDGYETRLGERGTALSAGQRQRIALARALYGEPFLVVLDEPNSNLDAEGEEALTAAIRSVRERGGIVIVIAHRPGVLAAVDTVAVMGNGQLVAFGPRDEVLRKTVKPGSAGHPQDPRLTPTRPRPETVA